MLQALKSNLLDVFSLEVHRAGTLANFLKSRPIDLVVDAGANLGQFAKSIRSKGYKGRICSFEPVGYVFEALQKSAISDPLWSVTKTALGNHAGTAELNVYGNHTLSSLLKPTELLSSYDTGVAVKTETVNIQTLDDLLGNDPAKHVFLKIDVQGFEKEVLEGAKKTLSRVVALYVELPIKNLYEGSWSFREAINFIDDLGFEPAQFRMVSPRTDDPASAIEFDSLFRRKAEVRT